MHRITSRQNRRIKDIRRLRRSKGSHGSELLLEGPNLVVAAVDAGLELREVLVTPEFAQQPAASPLLHRLGSTPLVEVPAHLLDELADADAPRGVLAFGVSPWGEGTMAPLEHGPVIFVDGIQDPGNLGAVARVAEAAGAAGLCLGRGTVHPGHPRALRASAGSLLRLPVTLAAEPAGVERSLGSPPPPWIQLRPRGGEDLYSAVLPDRLVLVLGSEGGGVSAALAARAERSLSIPMAPPVESLNVAVAAGVVLFELRRRHREASSTLLGATSPAPSGGVRGR